MRNLFSTQLEPPSAHTLSARTIEAIGARIRDAEFVLVTAGAGMSVDAGFDYTSEAQFMRRYPVLARRGPRSRYHLFGYDWPNEAVQWGHIARHLEELRFSPPPNPVPYAQLRTLTDDADRFVLTSNADDLFVRSGFAEDRVWTRQGSYGWLQCLAPCSDHATWPAEPWVALALPHVDRATEELTDTGLIPRCPRCGGPAMMNVRGGAWFIERPYVEQAERFHVWLERAQHGRLLVLDVGSGFNTPSVIRWPAEHLVAHHPAASLVRVNRFHPEVPAALGDRAIGVACTGAALWTALQHDAQMEVTPAR